MGGGWKIPKTLIAGGLEKLVEAGNISTNLINRE